MVTLNQISIRVSDVRSFRGLLEVYEDLAAQKMQNIRGEIAEYREYAKTLAMMSGELETDISAVIKKNTKQRAVVLISSDKGLYGKAFEGLGREFLEYLKDNRADTFVVGGVGEEIVRHQKIKVNYVAVKSDEGSLVSLWKTLGEYQELNIFHLRYDSLAKQSVEVVRISGDALPKDGEDYVYEEKNKLRYLYEPTVAGVVEVFAKEVLSFLVQQTMKESDLAKYAARLMYLDSCLERNNENLTEILKQKMILTKRLANKRQNARMAGYLARNINN